MRRTDRPPHLPAIARHLASAREAARLTQAELAEKLGLGSPENISRYERGERQPRPETVRRLAQALGTTSEALLGEGVSEAPHFPLREDQPRRVSDISTPYSASPRTSPTNRTLQALIRLLEDDLARLHELNPEAALLAIAKMLDTTGEQLRDAQR